MTRALFWWCEASARCWGRWLLLRASPLPLRLLLLTQ